MATLLTIADVLVIGRDYTFTYEGSTFTRHVCVKELFDHYFKGWDYTRNNYRSFYYNKMDEVVPC